MGPDRGALADAPQRDDATSSRSFVPKALWNVTALAALAAFGFVTTAIVYRTVGGAAYGIWATIAALKTFTLFFDSGVAFSVARQVAIGSSGTVAVSPPVRAAKTVAVFLGAAAVVAGIGLSWLPAAILGLDGEAARVASIVMMLAGVDAGLALSGSSWAGIARGLERFDIVGSAALVQAGIGTVLLLALTPAYGLTGGAVAIIGARFAWLVIVLGRVFHTRRGFLGFGGGWHSVRGVLGFAAPIWLVSIGTLIGLSTDVPIVGAFFGPLAAAGYAVGAVVPTVSLGLLYALVDSAYPLIARRPASAGAIVLRLASAATTLAGLGFTVLIVFGPTVLTLWLGSESDTSVQVLRIFAVTWALNVPTHVLALHAIAGARHRILVPLVLGEAIACLALSIILAKAGFVIGPALATLATLAISNLIIVPSVLIRTSGIGALAYARASFVGYVTGAAGGIGLSFIAILLGGTGPIGLAIALGLMLPVAALSLDRTVNDPSVLWRLVRVLAHGGFWTWRRQRIEVTHARARIAAERSTRPTIWVQSAPPLVTVRIATYNRGSLVRDRAIASALAQTYPNIEVLVIGDHCDAATEAAVRSVSDRRVRFENLSERGRYPSDPRYRWMVAGEAPMNRALQLMRGDWLAPLDDDDEFTPDHIEALLDACRTRDREFAYGIAEMETSPGTWELRGSWPLREGQIIHSAVLFSSRLRTIKHDIDSWRLEEPGDWNLWHRMRDAGARMGFVDHVVTRHYLERREIGSGIASTRLKREGADQ